ncbi:FAD-dependent oxidoreductase [Zavarzinia compransoris]|uniref:NAD(P)/FAD-dependent oxidoreductase n=1 Tax=Zavarzinia marina TaxID=2911065 RepID=UPI001F39BE0B|nr:FAD-dependent oxidoreductase [Zavarzinia marina]MCF4167255.1 FAD-dependent oxidoreductase [Zavarzinia marina]
MSEQSYSADARVVILGAGHAGGSAAAFLRQYGFAGPIVLIGDEPHAPYQRPPLSKAWLKGEADAASLMLKPAAFYTDQNVELRLSVAATAIDRAKKTVGLSDGNTIDYDILIIATGARARRLPIPGADLYGVLELRNADDAEKLKHAIGPGKRLAVVGGGYVGLEVAASGRALGAEAVVIEREARVLARVACPTLSNFFQDYHRAKGVEFELDAAVDAFVGDEGHVTGVRLADGRVIACDAAVVGVGAIPNDEIAGTAGLALDGGIVVDEAARTSDPAIFAVGDVTRRPLPLYARMHRLESVPNALEQAKQVASAITGRKAPAPEVPWFWSDQYDLKLQIAGIPFDADSIVVRGQPDSAKFAVFHLKGDRLLAVEAVNSPPEFMAGKMLIGNGKAVDAEKLANDTVSMKEVAA